MHADFHHIFAFKQLLESSEIAKTVTKLFKSNTHLHKGLILSLNTFQSAKKLSNCNDEKRYLNCSLPHEDVAQKMEEISNSIICIANMGFTKSISNYN